MTIDDIKAKASELYDDDSCSCVIFTKGALWRVESAWHEVSEEPERNRIYLAQLGDCAFDTFYDSQNWGKFSRGLNMKRWAYIKDLIPEE